MHDVGEHGAVPAFDQIEPVGPAHLTTAAHSLQPGDRLRYREELGAAGLLDAALTRRASGTLIVTFHGALEREKYTIPRFERVRTTEPHGTSCLYWADPSLWLDDSLALAWYTGAGTLDLFELLAERSRAVASAVGATKILFTGSSGGGFAALQTSALLPGSTALVFNPQTAISEYWKTVQRKYLAVCQPTAISVPALEFDFSYDWSARLSDRFSAVRRYSAPTQNRVHYWTNVNDWHHAKHFRPFRDAERHATADPARVTVHAYKGAKGHHTPSSELFTQAMTDCLASLSGGGSAA